MKVSFALFGIRIDHHTLWMRCAFIEHEQQNFTTAMTKSCSSWTHLDLNIVRANPHVLQVRILFLHIVEEGFVLRLREECDQGAVLTAAYGLGFRVCALLGEELPGACTRKTNTQSSFEC